MKLPTQTDRDTFAANLRRHREAAGLNQAKLAKRARLSRSAVSRLERGYHWPETATALLLCRALNISVDVLLEGTFWSTPPKTDRTGSA